MKSVVVCANNEFELRPPPVHGAFSVYILGYWVRKIDIESYGCLSPRIRYPKIYPKIPQNVFLGYLHPAIDFVFFLWASC